jgi:hypothetical protein
MRELSGLIHRPLKWLATGLLVLVALSACSLFGGGDEEEAAPPTEAAGAPTPVPTAQPPTQPPLTLPPSTVTPLPPPTADGEEEGGEGEGEKEEEGKEEEQQPDASGSDGPTYGELIYETDFSRDWPNEEYEGFGSMAASSSGYEVYVIYQALWPISLEIEEKKFYAELVAKPTQCPKGQAFYGLLFHYRNDTRYRVFVVTCSGKYAVFERVEQNRSVTIADGKLPGDIDASGGKHRLGVYAGDNVLNLYVDNYPIANVGVSDMFKGDMGPYVETTGAPITVLFKRLSVYKHK